MTTRLYCAFLALVLLILLSACTAGELPPKALEEGEDGSVVANLHLIVGKMVFANESD